ncbi:MULTISPECIES: hypothetical protein [Mycolicibacter]|uniref:Uncharacterized protein n=2 Tax=Mycolicibacter TaxID=1073531 RepID=A0ABU5XM77_9MYCO|nr:MULTISPECIES: hypothetical protein [unclassified Mycolicibacter]MEB3023073.1 hypothetical protein [Mycolicibacter sp. MYC098]MEB3033583.1 hypothetical protein [Mycolicibacter sp. MYC340]
MAEGLRASGQAAELVHTDTVASADDITADTDWTPSEAYQSGYSHGGRDANYSSAYEQATRETQLPFNLPPHFVGRDADDYQSGFTAGVSDFWEFDYPE